MPNKMTKKDRLENDVKRYLRYLISPMNSTDRPFTDSQRMLINIAEKYGKEETLAEVKHQYDWYLTTVLDRSYLK